MKSHLYCLAASIVLAFGPAVSHSATFQGRVYLDTNHNGRLDQGESGVAGALLSDGRRVASTDKTGRYQLAADDARVLLRVTVPRDYRSATTFWRWTDGQKDENFGLVRHPQPDKFCFIQITDTHVGRADVVRQFAEQTGKFPVPIAFVINTGDLVAGVDTLPVEKARPQYDSYMGAAAAFPVPLFNIPGNHEHVAVHFKDADKTSPFYSKGLYRQLLGPMHYSWDWGNVHFVALDGTSVPYQEKLGDEQLAWLKADLGFQPNDKPLVLFCHQSAPRLVDAKQLAGILRDRNVLGIFCGHLHSAFTTQLGDIPVYHTGAFCGSWWSGPNIDGSPQGFRLVQISADRMKTVYSNREGRTPIYIASPSGSVIQSGNIEIEVASLDFGQPLKPTAQYAGQSAPLSLISREELWSTWKGVVDTAKLCDGDRIVYVSSRMGDDVSTSSARYLVLNGRPEPYRADAPATLKFQVRGVRAVHEILLNGKPLGTIPANTPHNATLSFDIPSDRLTKVVQATVRLGVPGKSINVGPIWLEYKNKRFHDLRYATFERHPVSGTNAANSKPERDWHFCLP